jgi:acetyl/propionyl-CoA carboxylase alpha subunit
VDYVGAGTIEFIADASEGLRADRIWFMEMNTRLQVEHPVTEAITGLDLVEWQLRVASGEPLPLAQDRITISGHAIEARLYAEDPARGFLPSTGRLEELRIGDLDVRVDSGVEVGGEIGPFYDPMIAKLIAHEPTRAAAAERLAFACGSTEVWPVRTNAGFLARLLSEADFMSGQVDTGFIDARLERLTTAPAPSEFLRMEAAASLAPADDGTPWSNASLAGLRIAAAPATALIQAGETLFEARVDPLFAAAAPQGERSVVLFEGGEAFEFTRPRSAAEEQGGEGDGQILAPMPGRIASLGATVGAAVLRGQSLVTLEAMKMEHVLVAPFDGVVDEVRCAVGDQVTEGVLLVRLASPG